MLSGAMVGGKPLWGGSQGSCPSQGEVSRPFSVCRVSRGLWGLTPGHQPHLRRRSPGVTPAWGPAFQQVCQPPLQGHTHHTLSCH